MGAGSLGGDTVWGRTISVTSSMWHCTNFRSTPQIPEISRDIQEKSPDIAVENFLLGFEGGANFLNRLHTGLSPDAKVNLCAVFQS